MKDVKLQDRVGNGAKAKAGMAVDSDAIRELAALIDETGLSEIEIEQNGQRLRVTRQAAMVAAAAASFASAPGPVMSEPVASGTPSGAPAPRRETGTTITSPMVGTVYVAPEPGKPAFVKVGDQVKEGDTLLIVEAMKTMNPIAAPRAGTISEVCVSDSQPVEFGQALIVLS